MNNLTAAIALGAIIGGVALSLALAPKSAIAKDMAAKSPAVYKSSSIVIRQPWVRATPKGAPVAGGYATITNTGKTADRLTGATFATAGMVQIHEMSMTNGIMKMRHLEQGIEIKPGATLVLKPGAHHFMFMRLKGGVSTGQPVKGALIFEKAGTINVEFAVGPMGSKSAPGAIQDHKH